MKYLQFIILITFSMDINAQTKAKQSLNYLYLSSGSSLASTGDISGFFVSVGLQKSKNNWTHSFELSTTIHDGFNGLYFQLPNGQINDGSIRFSTGGIQLEGLSALNLFQGNKSNLSFGLGLVLRYQSTSRYDQYEVQYPALTGLSYPVIIFFNEEPMRTFAAAPIARFFYDYKISKKLLLGVSTSFQVDTNGDNFLNSGLKIGYQL